MLKNLVKRGLRHAGFDVRRYRPASSEDAQFLAMLREHDIDTVLDVGANAGQFASALRESGYRERIVSFEPLSSAREQLLKKSSKDALWQVAERAAIGAEDGEIEIHLAGNSVSSSVLEMLDAHATAAPESVYVGKEKVPLRKLDTVAGQYVAEEARLFVKIDTQGYEDRVLQGAEALLTRTLGLKLELSLVPLYVGQISYEEMTERLKGLGFELWAMSPAFTDPRNGRLLQIDATFFRRSA